MGNVEIVKHLELLYEFSKLDTNPKLKFKRFALKKAIDSIKINNFELDVKSIGPVTKQLIEEIKTTGKSQELRRYIRKFGDLRDLISNVGVGVKAAKKLYKDGIKSTAHLERAITNQNLDKKIMAAVKPRRMTYNKASSKANCIANTIRCRFPKHKIQVAGSLRRKKKFIKDVDLLTNSHECKNAFLCFGKIQDTGDSKCSIIVDGITIELRFCKPDEWGTSLLHLTGSKQFNIELRQHAKQNGLILNEYGIVKPGKHEHKFFDSEIDVFNFLGLGYTKPEKR